MIVVAIMGIVLTMGVPIVYKTWHKAPMTKAVSELMEVCSNARARAIMQGHEVDVIFHPRDRRFEVGTAPTPTSQRTATSGPPNQRQQPGPTGAAPANASGLSGQIPDQVAIELMDINKLPHEFREDDLARVRFFPNGTSDELTLILVSDQNQRCELTLEVTTGLMSVERDPKRFR
jgi:Tfp pilus assembly protein FimT